MEATVTLDGYQGELRQIVFDGLGHESPTFVLTNDLPERLTARQVIQTYVPRNHVEHSLGEKITFFHLDCLASEVRLNVDFDLTLTVAAAMLYQRLGARLKGLAESTPQTLFRKFVNTPGRMEITPEEVVIYLEKRSHNPGKTPRKAHHKVGFLVHYWPTWHLTVLRTSENVSDMQMTWS